jgi:hypothetical protein
MTAVGRLGVALPVPRKRARLASQSDVNEKQLDSRRVDHVVNELVADPDGN